MEEMDDLGVILFPHSYLSKPDREKVLTLFGPLTIFQPFFMEQPALLIERKDLEYVKIMTPPAHLNPGEDFKTLLTEYHTWMDQNRDKGYMEFLKRCQGAGLAENNTWEIREMIRRVEKHDSMPEKAHTQRWHMILHLAREFEDHRQEADRLLKKLKQQDSLLKGAIEDLELKNNFLEDLPQFESELLMNDHTLREVIEAWFALFGGYFQDHELLITFDRDVMKFCSQFMKDSGMEIGETHNLNMTFRFPDLSHQNSGNQTVAEKRYFDENKLTEFKDLIQAFRKDPEGNLFILNELSKESEASFKQDLCDRNLHIKMRHIPPSSEMGYSGTDGLFHDFLNKTIILMEEADHYA